MCLRRRWSLENFQLFLVEHPLVRHLTRRLIWGVYSAENQLLACFRVAEDNSSSTADDDLFTLPEGDISIGTPHVLEISPRMLPPLVSFLPTTNCYHRSASSTVTATP